MHCVLLCKRARTYTSVRITVSSLLARPMRFNNMMMAKPVIVWPRAQSHTKLLQPKSVFLPVSVLRILMRWTRTLFTLCMRTLISHSIRTQQSATYWPGLYTVRCMRSYSHRHQPHFIDHCDVDFAADHVRWTQFFYSGVIYQVIV